MSFVSAEISRLAGVGERPIDEEEFKVNFFSASVTAFADEEVAITHNPYTGEKRELYGELAFNQGSVAIALRKAAVQNGMIPGALVDYQRFAADLVWESGMQPRMFGSLRSGVSVMESTVVTDRNKVELVRKPELVVDYGAGLAGISHIRAQVAAVEQRHRPYCYVPLNRLPFTNRYLMRSYDTLLSEPGIHQAFLEQGLYIGREDGIASATNELMRLYRQATGSTEFADVVIASGIYTAGESEVNVGIRNAHSMLRPGGVLVVRSLLDPEGDQVGAGYMLETAYDAGFDGRKARIFEAITGDIGATLLGGKQHYRSLSAVLVKE